MVSMSAPANRVAPWEDFILRLIAVYKLLHAVFFMGAGFGLLKLRHHNIVDFLDHHLIIPYHLNPEEPLIDWMLGQAEKITPHTLSLLGYAFFFYAALFAAEGIGLYLRKHWAEWLVVVVSASLLPLEIYEFFHKMAMWKLAAVVGNLFIVGYLIHRITLDARLKAQARASGADNSPGGSGPDLNRSHQAPEERPRSTDAVSTKAR